MHHLPVTGTLDMATIKKMASPRCGLPDINNGGNKNSIMAQYKTRMYISLQRNAFHAK